MRSFQKWYGVRRGAGDVLRMDVPPDPVFSARQMGAKNTMTNLKFTNKAHAAWRDRTVDENNYSTTFE